MPFALAPKRKFSPMETWRRAQLADQDVVDELLGRDLRELLVEGDDDELGDAQAGDHVAL